MAKGPHGPGACYLVSAPPTRVAPTRSLSNRSGNSRVAVGLTLRCLCLRFTHALRRARLAIRNRRPLRPLFSLRTPSRVRGRRLARRRLERTLPGSDPSEASAGETTLGTDRYWSRSRPLSSSIRAMEIDAAYFVQSPARAHPPRFTRSIGVTVVRVRVRHGRSWRKNLALGAWAVTAVCAAAPEAMANDLLGSTSNIWIPAAAYGLTLLTAWGSSKK